MAGPDGGADMAVERRKSRERRAPGVDVAPASPRELRVDPRDRPGTIEHSEPTSKAKPGAREERRSGSDGERRRGRADAPPREAAPRKRKSGGRGGGRRKR